MLMIHDRRCRIAPGEKWCALNRPFIRELIARQDGDVCMIRLQDMIDFIDIASYIKDIHVFESTCKTKLPRHVGVPNLDWRALARFRLVVTPCANNTTLSRLGMRLSRDVRMQRLQGFFIRSDSVSLASLVHASAPLCVLTEKSATMFGSMFQGTVATASTTQVCFCFLLIGTQSKITNTLSHTLSPGAFECTCTGSFSNPTRATRAQRQHALAGLR
jgi:hypothetical protein